MNKQNDLPRWDLSNIYPSLDSPEFKKANQKLIKMADELDAYLAAHNTDPSKPIKESDPAKLANTIEASVAPPTDASVGYPN